MNSFQGDLRCFDSRDKAILLINSNLGAMRYRQWGSVEGILDRETGVLGSSRILPPTIV